MNKKVVALIVAILIVAIVAGIIFAVTWQSGNGTENNTNLGTTNNNNAMQKLQEANMKK